jgi:hypothetical protein
MRSGRSSLSMMGALRRRDKRFIACSRLWSRALCPRTSYKRDTQTLPKVTGEQLFGRKRDQELVQEGVVSMKASGRREEEQGAVDQLLR